MLDILIPDDNDFFKCSQENLALLSKGLFLGYPEHWLQPYCLLRGKMTGGSISTISMTKKQRYAEL